MCTENIQSADSANSDVSLLSNSIYLCSLTHFFYQNIPHTYLVGIFMIDGFCYLLRSKRLHARPEINLGNVAF